MARKKKSYVGKDRIKVGYEKTLIELAACDDFFDEFKKVDSNEKSQALIEKYLLSVENEAMDDYFSERMDSYEELRIEDLFPGEWASFLFSEDSNRVYVRDVPLGIDPKILEEMGDKLYNLDGAQQYIKIQNALGMKELPEILELFEILRAPEGVYTKGEREVARNKIIVANTGLVVSLAQKYSKIMPRNELIQEGNFGLLRAIEKYDPDSGCAFTTYAHTWVRARIMSCIHTATSSGISLSRAHSVKASKIVKICAQNEWNIFHLTEENILFIADVLDKSPKKIKEYVSNYAITQGVPLDKKVGDDEDMVLHNVIHSKETVESEVLRNEEEREEKDQLDLMWRAIGLLDPDEREIISRKYGVGDFDQPQTGPNIATSMGISRQAVYKLTVRIEAKLKKIMLDIDRYEDEYSNMSDDDYEELMVV